jgi:serine/threonine-protein kinase
MVKAAQPGPGTCIAGRFTLEAPLGSGSMGSVWLAEDARLGARVAVKLLRDHLLADPWATSRFFDEARIAARLGTPHVARIFDFGTTDDGRPFVVMEYLDGETLAARLRRTGPLRPSAVLRTLGPVARTLALAHSLGIVHRDLKPDNVFLALDPAAGTPVPKLIDFGVAKIEEDGPARESIGQLRVADAEDRILGTPPYMAPEQCAAAPDASHASDQWALGVVAYQCLTGMLPFPRAKRGRMHAVLLRAKFVPPSLVNAALPATIDAWMERALAIEPGARFPSMMGCIDALRLALEPPATPQRPGRKRAADLVVGAAALAFCAAALLATSRATSPVTVAMTPTPIPVAAGGAAAPASTACPAQPPAGQEKARDGTSPAWPEGPRALAASLPTASAGRGLHEVEQVVFPPARPTREARASHATTLAASYRPDPY